MTLKKKQAIDVTPMNIKTNIGLNNEYAPN
jgi:hypothetical protein